MDFDFNNVACAINYICILQLNNETILLQETQLSSRNSENYVGMNLNEDESKDFYSSHLFKPIIFMDFFSPSNFFIIFFPNQVLFQEIMHFIFVLQ